MHPLVEAGYSEHSSIPSFACTTGISQDVRGLTARHQFTLSLVPGRSAVSLPQHEAIVQAILAGDAAGAEAAMRAHLRSVIDALSALAAVSAS